MADRKFIDLEPREWKSARKRAREWKQFESELAITWLISVLVIIPLVFVVCVYLFPK